VLLHLLGVLLLLGVPFVSLCPHNRALPPPPPCTDWLGLVFMECTSLWHFRRGHRQRLGPAHLNRAQGASTKHREAFVILPFDVDRDEGCHCIILVSEMKGRKREREREGGGGTGENARRDVSGAMASSWVCTQADPAPTMPACFKYISPHALLFRRRLAKGCWV
jgi:hypothetical protein